MENVILLVLLDVKENVKVDAPMVVIQAVKVNAMEVVHQVVKMIVILDAMEIVINLVIAALVPHMVIKNFDFYKKIWYNYIIKD